MENKKTALITGISGFAGSHLAEFLLVKNFNVAGIIRKNSSKKNINQIESKLQLCQGDLLDPNFTEAALQEISPEYIFHLAAYPSPVKSFYNTAEFMSNNINAQVNLLEAIRKTNLNPRILIVGSAEVYGLINSSDLPINEETPFRPTSPYAVSKVTQDLLGYQYFVSHNLDIVRARPFNHIGPRLAPDFVVSAFSKKIAEIESGKREPILTVGNLSSKRDFTNVLDTVNAYFLLLEKGIKGEAYNVGSGKSYEIKKILDILLSNSTSNIEVKTDDTLIRQNDVPDFYCDNSKLIRATNWHPTINIEESVKQTLAYWREVI